MHKQTIGPAVWLADVSTHRVAESPRGGHFTDVEVGQPKRSQQGPWQRGDSCPMSFFAYV